MNRKNKPTFLATVLVGLPVLCLLPLLGASLAWAVANANTDSDNCGGVYSYTNGAAGKRLISARYGHRDAPETQDGHHGSENHMGVDIRMGSTATDKNAYSTVSGIVKEVHTSSPGTGLGNYIVIEKDGVLFTYGHIPVGMTKVTAGQQVTAGQVIANYSGATTGNSSGPHIHYSVTVPGPFGPVKVDPAIVEDMMSRTNGALCPDSRAFAQAVINATMAAHDMTDLRHPELKMGPYKDACKQNTPTTPAPTTPAPTTPAP